MESVWTEIQSQLEAREAAINEEIRSYPAPIPACDQHFNYLLDERRNIARELHRLEKIMESGAAEPSQAALAKGFITSSPYLNDG